MEQVMARMGVPMGKRVLGRSGRAIAVGVTLMPALACLGAFFPKLPAVGLFGTTLLSWFGPYIVLLSAVLVQRGIRHWRTRPSVATLAFLAQAATGLVGSVIVVAAQWYAASSHGIDIDPARALYVGPVHHASKSPEVLSYASFEGADLPVQIIRPPFSTRRPAPVLVYVHGGGWVGGVYWMRNHDLRWFADQGFTVVSLDYTLSSPTRHMWATNEAQIGCGLVWIKANIARFGGDPAHVFLIGESAGGNLVLNVTYRARNGTLQPICPGQLPTISAVVANYPVVDPADYARSKAGAEAARDYTGGSPGQFPNRYRKIASNSHLSASSPATLLIVGHADTVVAPEPAFALAMRAKALGANLELIDVPFGNHVFDFVAGSVPNQIYREATLLFLKRHNATPRPPN